MGNPELAVETERFSWRTQLLSGRTGVQLRDELDEAGIDYTWNVRGILRSKRFKEVRQPRQIKLARLKVADLGFNEPISTDEFYEKAKNLGLILCPPEVGPELRLSYRNQPKNETLWIGMKKINGQVFILNAGLGLWLSTATFEKRDYPQEWFPDTSVLFSLK